ncbi:MAG TPA: hypothetical protein VHU22_07500 [Xanthobacteraceae bacterium]|nr:hypothetical protein [Xanthobacteraceae bacterium]
MLRKIFEPLGAEFVGAGPRDAFAKLGVTQQAIVAFGEIKAE